MNHIGIDVHKKESQICILAEGSELLEQRIRTEAARLADVLGAIRARLRVPSRVGAPRVFEACYCFQIYRVLPNPRRIRRKRGRH